MVPDDILQSNQFRAVLNDIVVRHVPVMETLLKTKVVTKKLPKLLDSKYDMIRSVKNIVTNEADKAGWGFMEYQLNLAFIATEIFKAFAALFNLDITINAVLEPRYWEDPIPKHTPTVRWKIKSKDFGYTRKGLTHSTFEAYYETAQAIRIALDTLALEGKTTVEGL
jgi:hypothetical protein